jgi:hypothetical protein
MRHEAPGELARCQRFLLTLLSDPGGLEQAERRAARASVGEIASAAAVFEAGAGVSARERAGVYHAMYRLRLAREVAREYPATRALLGEARFGVLARAFVAAHPSRSFTLEGYAASLPGFLRRSPAIAEAPLRRAAADLARLERALDCVRRAPDPPREVAPRQSLARVLDAASRLKRAPGARLLTFRHDVEAGHARWLRDAPVGPLRPRPTALALFRRGSALVRLRVRSRELAFLRALLHGARLGGAVAAASDAGLGPAALAAALEKWVAAGLLSIPRGPE